MIVCISPSKSVMKQDQPAGLVHTKPLFAEQTAVLVRQLQGMSQKTLTRTLEVSHSLGELNYHRYQTWGETPKRAALWMYSGDVYNGVDAYSLDHESVAYAQDHLLIVSGLYGLLRPLDAVQPYRLEMKLPVASGRKRNLYQYWHDPFMKYFDATDQPVLLCASPEYARAVKSAALQKRIVTPRFMQDTDAGLREKGLFAKYARGVLARYVIDHQINDVEKLKDCNSEGMTFSDELSSEDEFVYILPAHFSLAGRFKKR